MNIHNVFGLVVVSVMGFGVQGCQKAWPESDLRVTNGTPVSPLEYQEVIDLSVGGNLCTGTFVGDNTVVTAAHCVEQLSPPEVRVGLRGPRALAIKMHPAYRGNVGPHDLAIVIFPVRTVTRWKKLSHVPPSPGDQITIVGYGKYNHFDDNSAGVKRKGSNVLRRRGGGGLHFDGVTGPAAGRQSGVNVASSSGDSGGPMFIDDEVVGITSGGVASQNVKYSFYVDLQYPSNRSFLVRTTQEGARIPSLTEPPPGGIVVPPANHDLFVALGQPENAAQDTYTLYFSTPTETDRVVFCFADAPTLCNTGEEVTEAKLATTWEDRKVYKALAATPITDAKTLYVVGYNASDIASVRSFQFERPSPVSP